jgi:hypothetical protein
MEHKGEKVGEFWRKGVIIDTQYNKGVKITKDTMSELSSTNEIEKINKYFGYKIQKNKSN